MRRFHQATAADGAGRSGLSALTYPAMMDYAANAAIAVALANTLFFAAATAQSRANVALYLLITVAPFAVVGLVAVGVSGAVSAGIAALTGSSGALLFTAVICLTGAALCLRIPSWVEVTEGEVPASLRTEATAALGAAQRRQPSCQPMGRHVIVALWGNGTVRVLTGFLTLFVAFAVRSQTEGSPGR